MALVGCGAQARSHLAAIRLVRRIDKVTVYDMNPEAAKRFCDEAAAKWGVETEACANVREAVRNADIICTLTPSKEPFLTADMVKPGTHIIFALPVYISPFMKPFA